MLKPVVGARGRQWLRRIGLLLLLAIAVFLPYAMVTDFPHNSRSPERCLSISSNKCLPQALFFLFIVPMGLILWWVWDARHVFSPVKVYGHLKKLRSLLLLLWSAIQKNKWLSFAIVVVAFYFYWNGVRPAFIARKCAWIAWDEVGHLGLGYDTYYEACLHVKGIR